MPEYLKLLADHLWQTTLFAGAAGLLTLALRKNAARVRYGVWLLASLKFLFPFSLLVWAGSRLPWRPVAETVSQPGLWFAADQVSRPFARPVTPAAAPLHSSGLGFPELMLLAVWTFGTVVVAFNWWRRWNGLRKAARAARPMAELQREIPVLFSPALQEPGVFGIRRPVLLLPEGIANRLTRTELETILEHELCHARRRDNLAAALHMFVEAIFWFYPLVWWIEGRLIQERERACDEAVLGSGRHPETYAEAILKVCRFYVESPLACAAGVTGANLKHRIEGIMTRQMGGRMGRGKKLLLASAGVAAVLLPVGAGMLGTPRLRAQSNPRVGFEVASIKENKAQDPRSMRAQFLPGGRLSVRDFPLILLIAAAYDVPPSDSPRLTGGPDWIRNTQYDIDATAEKGAIPDGASQQVQSDKMRLMLQALLADRFKLTIRHEIKDLPAYVVTVAKGGPKMPKAAVEQKDCKADPPSPDDPAACHIFRGGQGQGMHGQAVSLEDLVRGVERFADRPVVDQTGLKGLYNVQTEGWVPMRPRPPRPPGQDPSAEDLAFADPARPTIFQILDKLGLKMETQRAPVDTIVIVSVERPPEN